MSGGRKEKEKKNQKEKKKIIFYYACVPRVRCGPLNNTITKVEVHFTTQCEMVQQRAANVNKVAAGHHIN